MPIDKETVPNFVNVVFDDDKNIFDEMREQAEDDSQNWEKKEGEAKKMSLTTDKRSVDVSEYYFEDGNIYYSAGLSSKNGEDIFYSFEIPLSDKVLIDILEYSCKKLNKLKTALETLK